MPAQAELDVELKGSSECFRGPFANYDSWLKMLTSRGSDDANPEQLMEKMKAFYKRKTLKDTRKALNARTSYIKSMTPWFMAIMWLLKVSQTYQ